MTASVPGRGESLAAVRQAVTDAARAASRDPASITTVAVTKFHPASLVRELAALGVRDFGESRHQEAQPKIAGLADLEATWHFVGQLQGKKARQVRGYIDVLHSLDRGSLVAALGAGNDGADKDGAGNDGAGKDGVAGRMLGTFIQVDLGTDPGRGGVSPAELDALVEQTVAAGGLHLLGLMTVAPLDVEPRRAFARLRELSDRLRQTVPTASALSMGMSSDFREAIMEGATHLRIGTAITGNRPQHG